MRLRLSTTICLISISFLLLSFSPLELKFFHVVQMVPLSSDSYVSSLELKEISTGAELAIEDFRKSQKCAFRTVFDLYSNNVDGIYKRVREISRASGRHVIVGFSRSDYARLAALAAQKSTVVGISVGASSTELQTINDNFYSVTPFWIAQWHLLQLEINRIGCTKKQVLGIFDSSDHYSLGFKKAFREAGYHKILEIHSPEVAYQLSHNQSDNPCIFLGMNFSSSHEILGQIFLNHWKGMILGTGDWFYFSKELMIFVPKLKAAGIKMASPTSWRWPPTLRAERFRSRFKERVGRYPDPVAGFTYEATTLGLYHLCGLIRLKITTELEFSRLPLLRKYKGFSKTGNLDGTPYLIHYEELNVSGP